MHTSNPFAELSASIPPAVMQAYVVIMILLVAGGTLLDIVHKKSARYFFDNWRNAKEQRDAAGRRRRDGRRSRSQTAAVDVADLRRILQRAAPGRPSADDVRLPHLRRSPPPSWCSATRRPPRPTPAILPALWYIGALMVCVGGYWFWFFIRVDVAAEGNSPFRVVRADLFILSLVASATFGLIWAWLQTAGSALRRRVPGPLSHRHDGAVRIASRGPSSRTCSSSPRRPSRNAWQKRTARGSNLPAPADAPEKFGSARQHAAPLLIDSAPVFATRR